MSKSNDATKLFQMIETAECRYANDNKRLQELKKLRRRVVEEIEDYGSPPPEEVVENLLSLIERGALPSEQQVLKVVENCLNPETSSTSASDTDEERMTEGEIHEFGIQVVAEQLEKEGYEIQSVATDMNINPQIVAKKDDETAFILVRTDCYPSKGDLRDYVLINRLIAKASEHNAICYLASVGIANSQAEDDEGMSVPIRGSGFYVAYSGLERLKAKLQHLDDFRKPITDIKTFDKPRDLHYYFAHHFLRDKVASNPRRTLDDLSREKGSNYLRIHWAMIELSAENLSEEDKLISTDVIECFPIEIDDECSGVVVQLPPPERMTEAYYIGIIVWNPECYSSSGQTKDSYRYFTLELSRDGRTKRTVMGEWEDERHSNYGKGPVPNIDDFVQAMLRLSGKYNKKLADELNEQAIELMKAQRFDAALHLLHKAIDQDPSHWNTWYLAGQCYRFGNDLDNAVTYLEKAVELKPDEPSVLLALGIAFQLNDCFTEAINAFRYAIEIDPDYELAYNGLAVTQKKQGELELALHNYDAGAKALSRRIVKSLRNDRSNMIFKHLDIEHHLWLEYAAYGATYLCSINEDIQRMAWPTGEQAMREELTEGHEGLYWIDQFDSESNLVRLFLPNYFNTFRETLRQDNTFSNLIGNRGTILKKLGRYEEANQHFNEAEYFLPDT